MIVVKLPMPAGRIRQESLFAEGLAHFGNRFRDCNETDDGSTVGFYLHDEETEVSFLSSGPDVDACKGVLAAHDPTRLTPAERAMDRRVRAKAEFGLLADLAGKSPDQVVAWIDANVTTLATAKTALKLLARALVLLAQHGDIED